MRPHLTVEQRQLALRLKAKGPSLREIGPPVCCSHQGVALTGTRLRIMAVRANFLIDQLVICSIHRLTPRAVNTIVGWAPIESCWWW